MKYKHIAVFIRGHKRIWSHVKENIFYMYDQIADNVDYYVSVWETFSVDLDQMKKDFDGRNLIAIIPGPLMENYMDPWKSQSWLPYNLLPYKKIREREVTYDAVFDQRFDVALSDYTEQEKFIPFVLEKNKLYSTVWPVVNDNPNGNEERPHVKDYCFMAHSETFDLLCKRFEWDWDRANNIEHFFAQWLQKNGIEAKFVSIFRTILCRPNICEKLSVPITEINSSKDNGLYNLLNDSYDTWRNLSKEEKIKICNQFNIDLEDYLDNLQWN